MVAAKEEEPAVRGFKKLSPLGVNSLCGLKAQGLFPCLWSAAELLHPFETAEI